jgi:hypothetical protein
MHVIEMRPEVAVELLNLLKEVPRKRLMQKYGKYFVTIIGENLKEIPLAYLKDVKWLIKETNDSVLKESLLKYLPVN